MIAESTNQNRRDGTALVWAVRALGVAACLLAAWNIATLVWALPRHVGAATYWCELGAILAMWLPAGVAGVALFRRRTGFIGIYATAALLLTSGMVYVYPRLESVIGPSRLSQ